MVFNTMGYAILGLPGSGIPVSIMVDSSRLKDIIRNYLSRLLDTLSLAGGKECVL